jgi:UDP-N-acetylglucosamine--N-acetylmuramyl-(pentapeptide) pyrophosphoryl-undecaprenol N-acetylglucosamine transferase
METRVMIASGGTGGHVFPALAVANELRERGVEVTWLGTKKGMENRVVPEADIELDRISALGFRGKGVIAKLAALKGFGIGCIQALKIIRHRKPQVVLGMGGFVTAPAGFMARVMGIPVVIHEQNRVIGTANKLLSKIAIKIMEAFPDTFPAQDKVVLTGNPLRSEIINLAETLPGPRQQSHVVHLLIVGGSQGARALNQIVPQAIAVSTAPELEIIHQCGEQWVDETSQQYKQLGIDAQVNAFINDMATSYQWADLVICRAGAMTVSELAAVGLPSILVPYPFAIDDHQTSNAHYLADAGAAILIQEDQLTAEQLGQHLAQLLNDHQALSTMRSALKPLARINATNQVADICLQEAAA